MSQCSGKRYLCQIKDYSYTGKTILKSSKSIANVCGCLYVKLYIYEKNCSVYNLLNAFKNFLVLFGWPGLYVHPYSLFNMKPLKTIIENSWNSYNVIMKLVKLIIWKWKFLKKYCLFMYFSKITLTFIIIKDIIELK